MKSVSYLIFVLVVIFTILSCKTPSDKEFNQLKSKNLQGNELLQEIINFEVEHSNHFESKVQLADFYMLINNYEKAYEYAVHAESVLNNAPKGKNGNKLKSILFGDRAKLEYILKNYESALEYANKGIKADKEHGVFIKFTKAKILLELNKKQEAIDLLDSLYKTNIEDATSEDMQFYMYILANEKRYQDATKILEYYFKTGHYFTGLGAFASGIYEKTGDTARAILATFLDSEYYSCFNDSTHKEYLSNIKKLEEKLKKEGNYSVSENSLNYLKSYFSNDTSISYETDFFVKDYIDSVKKINSNKFTKNDLNNLLKIEKNFSAYPSYYWYTYKAFISLDSNIDKEVIPLLEKIIDIGNNNLYIEKAKYALGKMLGLTNIESTKILTSSEVISIIYEFQASNDENKLNPIFSLLELPENSYELFALNFLKQNYKLLKMEKNLQNKTLNCSAKLKERINYILN